MMKASVSRRLFEKGAVDSYRRQRDEEPCPAEQTHGLFANCAAKIITLCRTEEGVEQLFPGLKKHLNAPLSEKTKVQRGKTLGRMALLFDTQLTVSAVAQQQRVKFAAVTRTVQGAFARLAVLERQRPDLFDGEPIIPIETPDQPPLVWPTSQRPTA